MLSVIFSVNSLPHCCVSFSVFSSALVHVTSQHLKGVYEVLVAKKQPLAGGPFDKFNPTTKFHNSNFMTQ